MERGTFCCCLLMLGAEAGSEGVAHVSKLLPDVTYRPFQPDADLARLVALLEAVEAEDQEGEDVSEEAIAAMMSFAGHDPARDRWVAVAPDQPDQLLGYGAAFKTPAGKRGDIIIAVLPSLRRRGIGSELLAWVVARGKALGATSLAAYADSRLTAGDAFLRAHGFAPVSAYTQMRIGGEVVPPAPAWPDGYSARPYDPARDFGTLLDAFNRCFDGLWGHNPVTQAELAEWLPELLLEDIFLAFDGQGQLAGMVRAEPSPRLSARNGAPTVNIDAPGVVAERRAEPLYVPLLLTAWRLVRTLSPRPSLIELESWGDDPATIARYRDLGFALVRQQTSYRRDLAG